ncbi:hypothetical protein MNAN1_003712 [Malassezia nana]|uniref:F-box domain-containing protein n=1 Tax=Malassezia nana TaxID=180528 RepID=A0AAF0EMR7_9BASI|nr:hypothetical protein MNAN1_003712 [Malassezia nana]
MRALPGELVPLVLAPLAWRRSDLARCCLVCRWWYSHAAPLLYERLWLRDQTRLVRVFASLDASPALARWLRIVELRVFPFGMPAERLEKLETQIVHALQHAPHLRSLAWTRTGSLSDRVLPSIFPAMTCLERLELTGDTLTWSPDVLVRYMPRTIKDLAFVLPDRTLASHLVALVACLDGRLQRLSLVCMNSSVITDALLEDMAPHAPRLVALSLVGCKQVHGRGVQALVSPALRELALENVAITPDELVALAPRMERLTRLTVTTPRRAHDTPAFFETLAHLVAMCSDVQYLAVYAPGGRTPAVPSEAPHAAPRTPTIHLPSNVLASVSPSLRHLFLHHVSVPLAQLEALAVRVPHLHELDVYLLEATTESVQRLVRAFPALRRL